MANGICEVCGRGLETGEQAHAYRCREHLDAPTDRTIFVNPVARPPKVRAGSFTMPRLLGSDLAFYRLGRGATVHVGHVPDDWGATACGKRVNDTRSNEATLVTLFDPRQSPLCRVCAKWAEKRGRLVR